MRGQAKIIEEKNTMLGLKSLVDVYEEIAAIRMQRVRGAVLTSRQFLEEITEVFGRVRAAYKGEKVAGGWAKNGKTVAVFVSANAGLYGDIVDRIFDRFASYISVNKPELVVVGKLGVKMLADRGLNVLYNYFDFSDEAVEEENFALIMRYLMQFEQIVVFYGKFKSILNQDVEVTSLSGEEVGKLSAGVEAEGVEKYFFEPSPVEIARIFEGEIMASVFEQVLYESQLAKFASRMLSLDRALENVDKRIGEVDQRLRRLKHKITNSRQLSRLSGMTLWG